MNHNRLTGLPLLAALVAGCGNAPPSPTAIDEASGVTVHRGDLCIVDDSENGAYFRMRLDERKGPLFTLNELRPVRVELPHIGALVDIEGVSSLADGRIVVLSERLRALIGEAGLIAEYDYPLTEIGRRGLEGVAVRPLPDGSSRVAVVWEGGYPDAGSLQPQVEAKVGKGPFRPFVFIHDLKPGERVGRIPLASGVSAFELEVPQPEGVEPDAQRFRAPDMVWHALPNSSEEYEFIVLLSSQNVASKPQYLHHLLQRYDLAGRLKGAPLDIADFVPPEIAHANWEGVAWYERGKKLVIVHEASSKIPAQAFLLELPRDWQDPPSLPMADPPRANPSGARGTF